MKVVDAQAYATMVTFELDVEVDGEFFTYVGEWEFGKEHFYTIKDNFGNEATYDDPRADEVREFAKDYISKNAEDITLNRDY